MTNNILKSTKMELMETFVDGKWIITDCEETLTELIQKGYRILRFYSHKNKRQLIEDDEYGDIMEWLESIYDDHKVQKPLKRQLLILFMNNKAFALGKE